MISQPDRYLLKRQIKNNARYIKGKILDAGSGSGERYKRFFEFEKYINLDINPDTHPDILGSVENIPLDDDSVDSVVSTQVLEHIKNPQKAVEEFYRVLKPGGHCLATAPQANELHEEPDDYFRFTNFGLKALFQKAGFKIVKIEKRGGFWTLNAQIFIRYAVDLFHLNNHQTLQKIFNPFFWIFSGISIYMDGLDKSAANSKQAIGWLVVAKK